MCNTYRRLAMAADDDDTERYDIYIYVYKRYIRNDGIKHYIKQCKHENTNENP